MICVQESTSIVLVIFIVTIVYVDMHLFHYEFCELFHLSYKSSVLNWLFKSFSLFLKSDHDGLTLLIITKYTAIMLLIDLIFFSLA